MLYNIIYDKFNINIILFYPCSLMAILFGNHVTVFSDGVACVGIADFYLFFLKVFEWYDQFKTEVYIFSVV